MKFRKQLRESIGLLKRPNGVFGTRYTLEDIDTELDHRDKVIKKVERKADKHHRQKKKYLQKAVESKNQRKLRYVAKAKEAEMHKSFFSELFDNLMAQQLFLTKLSLKAKEKRIFDSPMEEFGFEIDIGGMNADAISNALQSSSFNQDEIGQTMEEIQMEFDMMDDSTGISLDLDDIKKEAEMLEAEDIRSDSFELGGDLNSAIDDQIEKELNNLEAGGSAGSSPGEEGPPTAND
ncbi:hypothetical protein ACFO0N_15105 [Halobium salinum]|uniref:Uncharacterized protein n=1 Tax=Halobium salinum TaxID=1364940 RepID=A0ABD5PES7_9EURY|nr:hypothetical protein [Halobium salinum]